MPVSSAIRKTRAGWRRIRCNIYKPLSAPLQVLLLGNLNARTYISDNIRLITSMLVSITKILPSAFCAFNQ